MIYSLFIGRWQPFHQGHKKLIETVLKEGKNACIAIRDTPISDKNPYTTEERMTRIQLEMQEYGDRVKVIVIPDIESIVVGRDVGYNIERRILDTVTEEISGTSIRDFLNKNAEINRLEGKIIW